MFFPCFFSSSNFIRPLTLDLIIWILCKESVTVLIEPVYNCINLRENRFHIPYSQVRCCERKFSTWKSFEIFAIFKAGIQFMVQLGLDVNVVSFMKFLSWINSSEIQSRCYYYKILSKILDDYSCTISCNILLVRCGKKLF